VDRKRRPPLFDDAETRIECAMTLSSETRVMTFGGIAGLVAVALVAAPASATPPPVPGADTYTIVDVNEVDFDNDGTIEQSTTTIETYDRRGRIQSSWVEDRQNDTSFTTVQNTTWEYDRQGKTLSTTMEFDDGGDGLVDLRTQITFEYDRSGQLVGIIQTYDNGADGIDVATTASTVTATKKAEISTVVDVDWDGDGTGDQRRVDTTTFDRRGNAVLQTSTTDNGADGTIELSERLMSTYDKDRLTSEFYEILLPYVESELTTYTYDRKGQLIGIAETYEPSGVSIVTALTFDADGVFTGSTRLVDQNGDGVVDQETIETVQSDDEGRPLVRQVDTFGDGEPFRETTTFVYGGDRLVDLTIESDRFIDGEPEFIERQTSVYDENDRLVMFTSATDEGNDGIDYVSTTTYVYDDRGEVISSTVEIDQNADGTIDIAETRTRTIT
jgi:hypothetical protein